MKLYRLNHPLLDYCNFSLLAQVKNVPLSQNLPLTVHVSYSIKYLRDHFVIAW